jgi:hypothetical protein
LRGKPDFTSYDYEIFLSISRMRYLSYRDHSIVSSGSFDELTRNYYPITCITWEKKYGPGHVHIIRNTPDRRETLEEACNLAVELAKSWIDRKLSLHGPSED